MGRLYQGKYLKLETIGSVEFHDRGQAFDVAIHASVQAAGLLHPAASRPMGLLGFSYWPFSAVSQPSSEL